MSNDRDIIERASIKQMSLFGADDFRPKIISKAAVMPHIEQAVSVRELVKKQAAMDRRNQRTAFRQKYGYGYTGTEQIKSPGLKSIFYDPFTLDKNYYGNIKTISPYYRRAISDRILRTVSQKCWVLNLCIRAVILKIRPFLKPATSENTRGFRIKRKDKEIKLLTEAEKKECKRIVEFIIKTGDAEDNMRDDDLDKYVTKILRDLLQLDKIATELQKTRGGELSAFWAIDAATIEVALPNNDDIRYLQVVDNIPYADFKKDELLFDFMNPRTDIEKAGYGYSLTEQAIDLITASINTFQFNSSYFTENRLPRGLLLLQGDADLEEVEEIEDYIVNLMSGTPPSQWRIPIIPSGKPDSGAEGSRRFEWVNFDQKNRDMEFSEWYDLQLSGIVALFGESIEGLGLQSKKSQPLIGADTSPRIESSKSLVLGDTLSFLQKHFNQILQYKNPDYELEFVGYEKNDPQLKMQSDKTDVETIMTIDEKRAERGLEAFKQPWSEKPLNAYVVQMSQGGGGDGASPFGGGMPDDEDDGAEEAGDSEVQEAETGGEADDEAWGDIGQEGKKSVEKSLGGKNVYRLTI